MIANIHREREKGRKRDLISSTDATWSIGIWDLGIGNVLSGKCVGDGAN